MFDESKVKLRKLEKRIPEVAFDLFRFWTKSVNINDTVIIKTEEKLIHDLKDSLIGAIKGLKEEDTSSTLEGWDIGFVIGYTGGNLGTKWYFEYVVKLSEDYKVFLGLKAIETFIKFDEIARIKIDELYKHLIEGDNNNIANLESLVKTHKLDVTKLEVVETDDSGRIISVVNNLILRYIKAISNMENPIRLPIRDYFSDKEIQEFIKDNIH